MVPQISVIMPIYNTGEILDATINSVLSQTFTDFELILIDDGSTDDSGKKCDLFAAKDSRIVVIHKANGGICAARNAGLRIARGEYITFCDHDDLYLPQLLQKEITTAEQAHADMTIVGKEVQTASGVRYAGKTFTYNRSEIGTHIIEFLENRLISTVWNVLYRRDVLQDITFDESFKRGNEDILFNLRVIQNANIVCGIDEHLYIHYIRGSLSTSAKFYMDAIPSLLKVHTQKMSVVLQYSEISPISKRSLYKLYWTGMADCLVYAIKAGIDCDAFCQLVSSLDYPAFQFTEITQISGKAALVSSLLYLKQPKVLYSIVKSKYQ